MFSKFKKWIFSCTIIIAILTWLYKIYRDEIRYQAAKLELKKKTKELEEKAEKNIIKKNQIITEIEKIDEEILDKKIKIDDINKKARDRIDVSDLDEDKKLKLFNKLVK